MTVRLADVAERTGVSAASVSRALTGTPGVSEKLAEHIRSVAASMGYVTNMHARSLAGGVSSVVGLIAGDVRDPYFAEIAGGLIDAAKATGRSVHVAHASSPAEVLQQVRILRADGVGSIVIASSGYVDQAEEQHIDVELAAYRAGGGAVAVIGRHAISANAALPDNVKAGRLLADHLRSLGHERVAVLAGARELTTVADRLAGLLAVFGELPVFYAEFSRVGGRDSARRALKAAPTALVALSDVMAVGAYAELRGSGISVPGEMSVVGFDDIAVSADLSPGLTTVRLDMSNIGVAALALASTEVGRVEDLGAEFVLRSSTGKPRP